MFCADIVDLIRLGGAHTLVLSRPDNLQVAQRRRFRRAVVTDSTGIELTVPNYSANPAKAFLYNISQDGMACRTIRSVGDAVLIGDVIMAKFKLPDCDFWFELRSIICNKTPGADEDAVILGLQFETNQIGRASCRERV